MYLGALLSAAGCVDAELAMRLGAARAEFDKLLPEKALVIRDGEELLIDACDLVIGDIEGCPLIVGLATAHIILGLFWKGKDEAKMQ